MCYVGLSETPGTLYIHVHCSTCTCTCMYNNMYKMYAYIEVPDLPVDFFHRLSQCW